jgi:hypothetical protein
MPQVVNFPESGHDGTTAGKRSPVSEFAELPPLGKFFTRGGVVGVRYAYVLLSNLIEFQRGGWEQLNPPVTFTVRGVPMACLGAGEPIRGISPFSRRPELFIDKAAKQALAATKEPISAEKQSPAPVGSEERSKPGVEDQNRPERVLRRQPPIE